AGRSLLPVGMVWVGGATLMALCGGFTLYALLALAITGVLYAGLGFKQAPAVEKRQVWRKELQEFGRPFIWIGIGGWLVQYADRWIVDFFFSGHQAGLYSLAVNMASFVPAMAGSVLLQWIFPRFFRQADQARNGDDWRVLARRCDRIAFAFMGISVAGLGVLWAMGPYLVPWLIDSQYLEAMPLLFSAGLAMAVVPMNQFHYLLLQCQHDSLNIAKTMLIVAAFKLIGTVVAAWFSWSVFLMWLVASFFACAFLGRFLVWRLALRGGCAVTDRVKD
ncbi:MAG TPA: oligosaccharide flippase family protein, partial [Verrucomicrobiota bacterium]|nr:oligosaccharide flippase family protein [Verrucomicrobiota bacterium]